MNNWEWHEGIRDLCSMCIMIKIGEIKMGRAPSACKPDWKQEDILHYVNRLA
jgi:hypothetical protein